MNKVIDKYHPDGIILATGRTKELDFDISKIKSNMILLNCWSKNYTGITILASEYSSSKNLIIDLINRKNNKIFQNLKDGCAVLVPYFPAIKGEVPPPHETRLLGSLKTPMLKQNRFFEFC